MEQPFAPRAAAPTVTGEKRGGAMSLWCAKKKDGRRFLTLDASSLAWFEDDTQQARKGIVKTSSLMSVERSAATVTVGTATKTHEFVFDSAEDAERVEMELKKHV